MTRTPSKTPLKKLSLQPGIIYGPVQSRRLGRSLGINLLPADYKLCSFNCLYCQYGWTKNVTFTPGDRLKDLPSPDAVTTALENTLAERDLMLEDLQQRMSELESRLDFTERLLAERNASLAGK